MLRKLRAWTAHFCRPRVTAVVCRVCQGSSARASSARASSARASSVYSPGRSRRTSLRNLSGWVPQFYGWCMSWLVTVQVSSKNCLCMVLGRLWPGSGGWGRGEGGWGQGEGGAEAGGRGVRPGGWGETGEDWGDGRRLARVGRLGGGGLDWGVRTKTKVIG